MSVPNKYSRSESPIRIQTYIEIGYRRYRVTSESFFDIYIEKDLLRPPK
jgi:hypothetical protein